MRFWFKVAEGVRLAKLVKRVGWKCRGQKVLLALAARSLYCADIRLPSLKITARTCFPFKLYSLACGTVERREYLDLDIYERLFSVT